MGITLVDFFKGEPACIQAKTFEQACKLCKSFHEMGKKWSEGNSYLDDILYAEYESETVYYNDCSMSSRLYAEKHGYPVYEYEQIEDFK